MKKEIIKELKELNSSLGDHNKAIALLQQLKKRQVHMDKSQ